jgi:hypothetical protein
MLQQSLKWTIISLTRKATIHLQYSKRILRKVSYLVLEYGCFGRLLWHKPLPAKSFLQLALRLVIECFLCKHISTILALFCQYNFIIFLEIKKLCSVIRFVSISAEFGICTVVGLGHLLKIKRYGDKTQHYTIFTSQNVTVTKRSCTQRSSHKM